MTAILERQRKDITKGQPVQLVLDFNDAETRQVEADRRFWSQRLMAIESELRTEPERIRRAYEVKVWRVEPLGVVYLWPRSG